jgi:AraC family transcriptional regulator of adaptative response/methylated-DNA-[protein]-cysteine methyltransferase
MDSSLALALPDDPLDAAEAFHPPPPNRQIATAIAYLVEHAREQPSLEQVAAEAGMSPFHFQRVFKRWAGISPKRFLQYVTLTNAKRCLIDDASVLEAALDSGLSGPSRLHDLFVACAAITPGEFKAQGSSLVVRWGLHDSPLGRVLLGTTERGICWLSFVAGADDPVIAEFRHEWLGATLVRDQAATAPVVAGIFDPHERPSQPLPLLLRGTNFQIKVWEALLKVPFGQLTTYRTIAAAIGRPTAARAVGRAIGRNNISWLIPCHRVILGTGIMHNYRWGVRQKQILTSFEGALAAAGDD